MIFAKPMNKVKEIINKKNLDYMYKVIFVLIFAYRIYLCFQVPYGTDPLWHLGFASHAFDNMFSIYQLTSTNFQPESWTNFWPGLPYLYPPVTLLFFFVFAKLNLGIFWVKLVLTIIDSGIAYLLFCKISALSALLFYCAPISLWFVSYEGQCDNLQTLFIALNVIFSQSKKWLLSGILFCLSIQVKLFGVLLLPWILYEAWLSRRSGSFLKLVQGFAFGWLPFLGFYLQKPDLLFIPFREVQSDKARSIMALNINPFKWAPWATDGLPIAFPYVSSLLTYILLFVLLTSILIYFRRSKIRSVISFIPLTTYIILLKSFVQGRLWYILLIPGFLFCYPKKVTLVNIILGIYLMLGARALFSLLGDPLELVNLTNSSTMQNLQEQCMFICNFRANL